MSNSGMGHELLIVEIARALHKMIPAGLSDEEITEALEKANSKMRLVYHEGSTYRQEGANYAKAANQKYKDLLAEFLGKTDKELRTIKTRYGLLLDYGDVPPELADYQGVLEDTKAILEEQIVARYYDEGSAFQPK